MGSEAPDTRPSSPGDTISRNTVFAFASQVTTAFFTAVLTFYLVRALGVAAFGTFSLAVGITGLVLRPSSAGTTQSAARFIAERIGDTESIAGVLGMALRTRLLTATATALALIVLAAPIADLYNAPHLVWPLRAVSISLFGQSIFGFVGAVFIAMRRISSGFILVLSESAMELSASVALVLLGGGATAAAFGRAVGYVFGAALGVILLARLLGRSPLFGTGPSPVSRREFVGYASAMLIVIGASAAYSVIDTLLIGALLTTTAVGLFSAPLRLIVLISYPGLAMSQGVAPRLARHPEHEAQIEVLGRAIRYTVIVGAATIAFTTVWATPVVDLVLGSKYSESAAVLRGLTPLVFLTGLAPVVIAPLNYRGEARRRIPASLGMLVLNAVIDLILIPKIGILGAAVGTDVAIAVNVGINIWLCHQLLGLPLELVGASIARSLLAAGAMTSVMALFGTHSLSPIEWVVGIAAGTAAFAAVLLLTRELSPGEMRSLTTLPLRTLRSG